MKFYTILWIYCAISAVNSLECGLSSNQNQEDIRRYTSMCIMKTEEPTEITSSEQSYENYFEEVNQASGSSMLSSSPSRYPSDSDQESKDKQLNLPNNAPVVNNNSVPNGANINDTEITNDCVVQCVLKRLGMVDSSGYPDHVRISENLMKGVENRQLKDFLQDSTDDCFQMMEQDVHVDPCYFSTQLIKCLAEKGKSNCGDWPMTELPFPHIF